MKMLKQMSALPLAALAALAFASSAPALAAYPDKPIRMVVGFSPGGGVDVVGRIMAQALGEQLNTTVVVENKSGFSGNIAAQQVKQSDPDGYTLLMAPTTSYALVQTMLGTKQVGYDLVKDFKSAGTVGILPLVVIVNRSLGVNTLQELVSAANAKDKKLAYGSSGNGSTEHIITELFLQKAKMGMLHVPYRGSSPAMADLLSGEIQLFMATTPTALANLASGRLTAIGIASPQRLPILADVPTLDEQGLKDFEAASIYSILLPSGTPTAVLEKLNAALEKAFQSTALQDKLMQLGVKVQPGTLEESSRQLADEAAKWPRAIKALNLSSN
ncbi:tripartite tricarboxylate transporter substrate binding protein [Pollutimonas sp. H1-120]|uniref:Bug family tripartite tricarboxylate transporter substrate binding protein n=1 Tax=Pollutimonas sp. H1-120 TaxID=3148824 RepID=UPI003B516564